MQENFLGGFVGSDQCICVLFREIATVAIEVVRDDAFQKDIAEGDKIHHIVVGHRWFDLSNCVTRLESGANIRNQ